MPGIAIAAPAKHDGLWTMTSEQLEAMREALLAARYRGVRKNLFDWRRVAVIHNLHVLQRGRAAALPDVA